MNVMHQPTCCLRLTTASMLLMAATAVSAAAVAPPTKVANADTRYLHDRTACYRGQAVQDRSTCLREAVAARAEAQRGGFDRDAESYLDNSHLRCTALPDALRGDCHARMNGEGTTTGSVAAGGIFRELVTRTPAAGSNAKPDAHSHHKSGATTATDVPPQPDAARDMKRGLGSQNAPLR